MPCSVLIVSEHLLARVGLRWLLEERGRYRGIVEAATTDSALQVLKKHRPALILLDIECGTVSRVRTLLETAPSVKIVGVSSRSDPRVLLSAVGSGVHGFVVCDGDGGGPLLDVLERVRRGERALCPTSLRLILEIAGLHESHTQAEALTSQQLKVLALVSTGASNREIAENLYLSPRTVKRHVSMILRKLGVRSRAAAIAKAGQWLAAPAQPDPSEAEAERKGIDGWSGR